AHTRQFRADGAVGADAGPRGLHRGHAVPAVPASGPCVRSLHRGPAISSGAVLAHQSDLSKLTDAMSSFRPSFILGVPRVFEKVFNSALANAQAGGKEKIFRRAERVAVAYSRALDA